MARKFIWIQGRLRISISDVAKTPPKVKRIACLIRINRKSPVDLNESARSDLNFTRRQNLDGLHSISQGLISRYAIVNNCERSHM